MSNVYFIVLLRFCMTCLKQFIYTIDLFRDKTRACAYLPNLDLR